MKKCVVQNWYIDIFIMNFPRLQYALRCIGAICDYMDNTPLMQELIIQFERRGLFLDAGLLFRRP